MTVSATLSVSPTPLFDSVVSASASVGWSYWSLQPRELAGKPLPHLLVPASCAAHRPSCAARSDREPVAQRFDERNGVRHIQLNSDRDIQRKRNGDRHIHIHGDRYLHLDGDRYIHLHGDRYIHSHALAQWERHRLSHRLRNRLLDSQPGEWVSRHCVHGCGTEPCQYSRRLQGCSAAVSRVTCLCQGGSLPDAAVLNIQAPQLFYRVGTSFESQRFEETRSELRVGECGGVVPACPCLPCSGVTCLLEELRTRSLNKQTNSPSPRVRLLIDRRRTPSRRAAQRPRRSAAALLGRAAPPPRR